MVDERKLKPVSAPWVWTAADIANRNDWIYRLDGNSISELNSALKIVKDRGLPMEKVEKSDFPLPSLSKVLGEISKQLENGLGFCLLKGLPIDRYNEDDLELIYWGIGTHIGVGVSQSFRGDKLGHVMDMSHTGDIRRSYRSPRPLRLHVDPVDIVGLLCHRTSKTGGTSLICSSMAVHNSILENNPKELPILFDGFHYHSTEDPKNGDSIATPYRIPVFADVEGQRVCVFNGPPIDRWIKENQTKFSEKEKNALACFHQTTVRKDLVYRMDLDVGDIQFLNNRAILHGRTEFQDHPELERKRHMLRLWLMVPEWAQLPPHMKQRTKHDRFGGGVPVTN